MSDLTTTVVRLHLSNESGLIVYLGSRLHRRPRCYYVHDAHVTYVRIHGEKCVSLLPSADAAAAEGNSAKHAPSPKSDVQSVFTGPRNPVDRRQLQLSETDRCCML